MSKYNLCIDFGTCNTVISYNESDKILQILDDNTGQVFIPSTLYFIKEQLTSDINEIIYLNHYNIGSVADELYSSEKNISMYFYQFKRFLGITSHSISKYKNFLDKFNLEYSTDEDTIYFYLETINSNKKIKLSIIDLINLYFKGLYSIIKQRLNIDKKIEIYITCPAYFNDLQRSQLKNAVEKSGFIVNKIYNEPTVAAIYYINKYKDLNKKSKFIIYDLGGGTIDTTVVDYHLEDNTCEVIDIDGDNNLGGIDIDNILVYDIYEKYNIDKNNLKWKHKIRKYAEEIKIKLTYNNNHDIYLENVPIIKYDSIDIIDNLKISYSKHYFNSLINEIIEKMIQPIKNMHDKYKTNNIIFIGGPTQIPLLKNKINSYINNTVKTSDEFENNNILYKTIVSQGGTLLYNILSEKKDFYLLDIIPMNIGISDTNNEMIIMIEKNSKIPLSIEKTFSTSHDCQRSIDIEIFEGIHKECSLNTFIGSYKIIGIPPLQKGMILIKLLFKISYNGILNISINGFKNSNDNSTKSFDFKICENIKLIPNIIAKDLLKKLLLLKK